MSGSAREGSTGAPLVARLELPLGAWIGIAILAFWLAICAFGPAIAPHAEDAVITDESFAAPGVVGLLGSDYLGRDVLSRLLYGARMTLGLALMATALSFSIGIGLGLVAATLGGLVDGILSRVNDAIMSFPSIMLALIVIASMGTSIPILIVTVGLIDATRVFRLSRALGMDIAVMDFVDIARARGEGVWWIIRREILPNAVAPLSAEFGLRFTFSILFISSLSFLGLGVQPPAADWGAMVRQNLAGLMFGSPASLLPAAAIGSVTIGINLIIDAVLGQMNRDISDEMTV